MYSITLSSGKDNFTDNQYNTDQFFNKHVVYAYDIYCFVKAAYHLPSVSVCLVLCGVVKCTHWTDC